MRIAPSGILLAWAWLGVAADASAQAGIGTAHARRDATGSVANARGDARRHRRR